MVIGQRTSTLRENWGRFKRGGRASEVVICLDFSTTETRLGFSDVVFNSVKLWEEKTDKMQAVVQMNSAESSIINIHATRVSGHLIR